MRTSWLTCESEAWLQALPHFRHDVYHLPGYTRVWAERERGEGGAFLAEEGEERLLLPLIVKPVDVLEGEAARCFDAVSPYGYPAPLLAPATGAQTDAFFARAISALLDTLREKDVVSLFVRLHPLHPLPQTPLARAGRLVHHGDTVSIDLTLPPASLWRQTRASSRNEIRRARRAGLAVRHDPAWDGFAAFFDLYHETMRRVAAHPSYRFDRAFFSALRTALGEALHLFVVQAGEETAAAGLFTEVDGTVQYFLSGTQTSFLDLHPAKLMLDHVRTWARARGNEVLHLGGGVGGREDSLFRFKAGFSPRRHPFRTWRVVVRPDRYEALCRHRFGAEAAAGRQDAFFPAYRAPEP